MEADQDGDGKLSFEEFAQTVANTVCVALSCPLIVPLTDPCIGYRQTNDPGGSVLSIGSNDNHALPLALILL